MDLLTEIKELRIKIAIMEERLKSHEEHCERMFKMQLEGQETTNKRISQMSDRLHHHIMNL